MTKNFTYVEKHSGDPLSHTEWNNLAQDVDALVTGVNNGTIGGSSQSGTDPHVSFDEVANGGKNNLTIATTAEDQYQDGSKTKGGKINIEPISDLQIKPGDDVCLCSHHREDPTEVSVKVLDGEDNPVKLQLNAANIVLTTKDKNKTKVKDASGADTNEALYDDPNVLNVTVNSSKNTRGYLKVRAQAIDLRCEDNGGIALQPKGNDSNSHENKIKFEHNGGDGVEFGTFNTLHTSIFTNDYRFNANGDVYAVTRGPLETTYKEDGVTVKKIDYPTQADDFKDILDNNKKCTWGNIVSVADNLSNKDTILKMKTKLVNGVTQPDCVSLLYMGEYTFSSINPVPSGYPELTPQAGMSWINGDINSVTAGTSYTSGDLIRIFGKENLDSNILAMFATGLENMEINVQWPNGTAVLTKTSGNIEVSLKDIVSLVDYFKTGAGQANGPWNNV